MPDTLASLRDQLTPDLERAEKPFSDDIADANEVLLDPFSSDAEKEGAMREWLKGYSAQPCVFGKIAGSKGGMDFCFIRSEDINASDERVIEKIAAARRFWKQRAFVGMPKHGFMVIVCDKDVAFAAADEALYRFSLRVQKLARWPAAPESRNNDLVQEQLYLTNPHDGKIVRFTFSVDYFASAADQRWWHDHRVPGGIAFTANSLGHMARHQQWYDKRGERVEWALRTAMNTIDSAATEHPYCPATYLLDLQGGKPVREFNWNGSNPMPPAKNFEGKDCGSYGGYLHTDHAIRAEFFRPDACPMHHANPYLMDFTYIFDTAEADHLTFMVGEEVSREEVEAAIGPIGDTETISAGPSTLTGARPAVAAQRIGDAIERLRSKAMSDDEIERLLD
jgi:hypothetical protein